MNILLDECVDARFSNLVTGHYVRTVPQMGWAGVKNGDLMKLAEAEFDVFLTVDRNLSYQQNLTRFSIGLLVLKAKSNRIDDLAPFAKKVLDELEAVIPGAAVVISL